MLIDVNSWIGRWPFQQIGNWSLEAMTKSLEHAGVNIAFTASLEGVLLPDPLPAERELAVALSKHQASSLRWIHTPLICVMNARWKADLAEAKDRFGARLIRIAPSYRPAPLERFLDLIATAHNMGIHVALVMRLEDIRTQSRILNVASVPVEDVIHLATGAAKIPLLVLNALSSELKTLSTSANLHFDTSMLDGSSPIAAAADLVRDRLVFGTAAPLLEPAANVAKLRHADLPSAVTLGVESKNVGLSGF